MSSLPVLPDPGTVKDAASASDALSGALAAVATVSKQLAVVPPPGREQEHPFKELKGWIGQFHELLVKIAAKHACLISWSVTVGTPFSLTLTVNFADRARTEPDQDFREPGGTPSDPGPRVVPTEGGSS